MNTEKSAEKVFEILKRDSFSIYSEQGLEDKLLSGKKLVVKLGADPSRPDLHLGHSVVLRKIKLLQDLGHEIVFVIGDFTGMIGDPSGRSKTRVPLTFEQSRINGETYFNQVTKILDRDKTKIVYNSEWLLKMNFADVLNLAGKYTVAQIMERDDFAKRYSTNQPIGIHEMLYPLMQGYDSVALNADIEVGGTDQTFNLLVGRELQRDYEQTPQEVITFPLLLGLDGKEKMSKSLDNYIGIDEPAEIMFEKCMKVPDELLADYFRLTTDIEQTVYEPIMSGDIRKAHILYAQTIVTMYHNTEEARSAEERYMRISSGGMPQDLATLTVSATDGEVSLIEILRQADFASSNGDARRLILGGGVKIDGSAVTDASFKVKAGSVFVLSRGKNKFIRVEVE